MKANNRYDFPMPHFLHLTYYKETETFQECEIEWLHWQACLPPWWNCPQKYVFQQHKAQEHTAKMHGLEP